ncbi:hypothetical protein DPMN_136835 [Dreissena polymorpha]|uniref:Uncharacterized protein n=1 Tax=Dreissena polymorpha TaxID=45954 RepID=A0A9D4G0L9_DREPO|nr:hypothetical protein DPMN_136835 [Dreissena polymorpha]
MQSFSQQTATIGYRFSLVLLILSIQIQSAYSLPVAFHLRFHIDRLRNAAQVPCIQVDELMELGHVDDHKRVRLVGGTGIFCDPNTFPSPQDMFGLPSNAGVKKAAANGQNTQNFRQHTHICSRKNRWRSSRQRDNTGKANLAKLAAHTTDTKSKIEVGSCGE